MPERQRVSQTTGGQHQLSYALQLLRDVMRRREDTILKEDVSALGPLIDETSALCDRIEALTDSPAGEGIGPGGWPPHVLEEAHQVLSAVRAIHLRQREALVRLYRDISEELVSLQTKVAMLKVYRMPSGINHQPGKEWKA